MRIAIAGAGITGTTVGFLLAEQGHEVTIFEQAKVCQPVGAGIMLQNSGQQVLDRLGLLADLADAAGDHLADFGRINPCPVDQFFLDLGQQVGRVHC